MSEFTKEQLEAIKIVDNLYSLKSDCDKSAERFASFIKKNPSALCRIGKSDNHNFSFVVPKMFCDLLDAMERGDLIWKDA